MTATVAEWGAGAGLAALGFWVFIGVTVIAGVWDSIRKRDAQHETLRRIVESGQPIDADLTDKLLSLTGNRNLDRDLQVSGVITLCVAPGMVLLGWFLARSLASELWSIMLGVAALILCVAGGLLLAAYLVRRSAGDR